MCTAPPALLQTLVSLPSPPAAQVQRVLQTSKSLPAALAKRFAFLNKSAQVVYPVQQMYGPVVREPLPGVLVLRVHA